MAPPPTTFVVRSEAQLSALLHVQYGGHLLAQFRDGATASEAARRLGEPAPRVSYHVRRLTALGLLVPVEGNGRGRRLRPAAERFVAGPEVRGLLSRETARPFLTALTDAFLAAQERPQEKDPGGEEVLLLDLRRTAGKPKPPTAPAHAPRALLRMVRLTPEAYARVYAQVWEAITAEPEADPDTPGARYFTLSLLGFPGTVLPLSETEAERPTHAE